MTVFEDLKSMNIDELAEWFEANCVHDDDPCIRWWNDTYCQRCDAVVKDGQEYAYCELYDKCRYFQAMGYMPTTKQQIKLWLKGEVEEIPMPTDADAPPVEIEEVYYDR